MQSLKVRISVCLSVRLSIRFGGRGLPVDVRGRLLPAQNGLAAKQDTAGAEVSRPARTTMEVVRAALLFCKVAGLVLTSILSSLCLPSQCHA